MAARNKHLEGVIPAFYRREVLHVMIFTFIDTYRLLFPSVTITEAADAFMRRHVIFQDEYSVNTVIAIFTRVNQDIIDAERFQNQQKVQSQKAS
jgi:hypothetical protein